VEEPAPGDITEKKFRGGRGEFERRKKKPSKKIKKKHGGRKVTTKKIRQNHPTYGQSFQGKWGNGYLLTDRSNPPEELKKKKKKKKKNI